MLLNFINENELSDFIKKDSISVLALSAEFDDSREDLKELLTVLSTRFDKIFFAMADAEKLMTFCESHKIQCLPTLLFYKCNQLLKSIVGFKPDQITSTVENYSKDPLDFVRVAPLVNLTKEDRMKALIKSHPVMLFMKGSPTEPKCGFSRTIIAILDELDIEYGTFDILLDNEIREGLKVFSNWPTYPQLYHDGELLGGLDIVKAMKEGGELNSLPKKSH